MLSAKDIRQWEIFDGKEESWPAWAFATGAALAALGWGGMIDAAKTHTTPIDDARLNASAQRVSANLYSLLAQRTRGKA